jgi:hypothetical protein
VVIGDGKADVGIGIASAAAQHSTAQHKYEGVSEDDLLVEIAGDRVEIIDKCGAGRFRVLTSPRK